jgi:glyoxylase-like metal-dependent hydrolase (beta-lactamase superfamily II)
MMNKIEISPFFDEVTKTITYVVTDVASRQAAVIDPVLGFCPRTGVYRTENADQIIDFLSANNLQLEWILETNVHADHITAAKYFKSQRGGQIGIGEHVRKVEATYKQNVSLESKTPCNSQEFDYLFQDGEVFFLGHIEVEVIATPGCTPACVSYKIADAVFVGKTLFMPDLGAPQTDPPFGSAKALYQSIKKILSLPEFTRIFVGHGQRYIERDRSAWQTTVLQEKRDNIHVNNGITESAFVQSHAQGDGDASEATRSMPLLEMNMRAGSLPERASHTGLHRKR